MTTISDQPHDSIESVVESESFKEYLARTVEFQEASRRAMKLQVEYMAWRDSQGLNPTVTQVQYFNWLAEEYALVTGVMIYPWSGPVD